MSINPSIWWLVWALLFAAAPVGAFIYAFRAGIEYALRYICDRYEVIDMHPERGNDKISSKIIEADFYDFDDDSFLDDAEDDDLRRFRVEVDEE